MVLKLVDKMDVQGLKVLVIDDSNTIRRTAETLLAKAGCDVVTASDGFDSLAKIVDISRRYRLGSRPR